jgi:anti-sigma factor RsiW
MNHQTIQQQISVLIDDVLDAEEQSTVFRHLSDCEECRTFFQRTQRVSRAMHRLTDSPVPDAMDQKFGILDAGLQVRPTASLRSALVSVGAVLLMSVFIYIIGTVQAEGTMQQYHNTVSPVPYTSVDHRTTSPEVR